MNLVILEGPDNLGKNFIFNNLCKKSDNYIVRHFGAAIGTSDLEKTKNQYSFFDKEFKLTSNRHQFSNTDKLRYSRDFYGWNRSHLGEACYGTLYRPSQSTNWIYDLEKRYNFDIDKSIYLILLTAPVDFLLSHDDGKSISTDNSKKHQELSLFNEAFSNSSIQNKLKIDVSNGNDYLNIDLIVDKIEKFVF